MSEFVNYVTTEENCRNLALDYAIGVSLIGLLPISGLITLKLILAIGIIIKMIWDIGKKWRFVKKQDLLAIAGYFLGLLGAVATALCSWLTLLVIGSAIPYVAGLRVGASLFVFTWMVGQATNQFYAIGQLKLIKRKERENEI